MGENEDDYCRLRSTQLFAAGRGATDDQLTNLYNPKTQGVVRVEGCGIIAICGEGSLSDLSVEERHRNAPMIPPWAVAARDTSWITVLENSATMIASGKQQCGENGRLLYNRLRMFPSGPD